MFDDIFYGKKKKIPLTKVLSELRAVSASFKANSGSPNDK